MVTQQTILKAPLSELIDLSIEAEKSMRNEYLLHNVSQIKFKAGIGRTLFAEAFGFRTKDYYTDPETSMAAQLRWKLWTFYVLQDDTPFDLDVGVDYATALEPSLFGLNSVRKEGQEPTYGAAVIKDPRELDEMALPDFYTSGLMPEALSMYRSLLELSKGRLRVFLPGFARGPWSIATILRGFNEIFLDCMDDENFVHRLMQYIVDSRIKYETQRCEFLGITPQDRDYRWKYVIYRNNANSDLFEDEVDGGLFSPQIYRELIFPYEKQLSDFYGGIHYYHSCGNLSGFMDDISMLNIYGLQHISPWTDYAKAAAVLAPKVTMQVSLHTTNDVLNADEAHIRNRIQGIVAHAAGRNVDICADALYEGGWRVLDIAKNVCRIFREVVG